MQLDPSETELTIDAPRFGWERGTTYVVMVRGGDSGVEGKLGEKVVADAAFYFLRLTQSLIGTHDLAYPGATLAEKQENAEKLEEIRQDLAPYFAFFEDRGIPRTEVASLWAFTVTEKVELAMDKASQRMSPVQALLDFPLNLSLFFVGDVYHGTIKSPLFLSIRRRGRCALTAATSWSTCPSR